jgi:NAD(P)-dependent dehydrogenase (short-subunit alcohol dehydrogenase family)
MPVAVVTGGSQGLGQAIVTGLLEEGWSVVTDARDGERLAVTATELAAGDRLVALAGDVTEPLHRAALVAAAEQLGRLELVVNNAGGLGPSPLPHLADYPLPALAGLFDVNVLAPLALVQLALPALRANRGAVVMVTSDAAIEGYPGWGGYGATKAALEHVGRVLAAEEADVRVYSVDPGDLRTQMHQDAFPGEDISDRPLPEVAVPGLLRLVRERPPSGRYRAQEMQEVPT